MPRHIPFFLVNVNKLDTNRTPLLFVKDCFTIVQALSKLIAHRCLSGERHNMIMYILKCSKSP